MPGILDHLKAPLRPVPQTTEEIWKDIVTMRANKLEASDLPISQNELLRMLRMYKAAGGLDEVDGKWVVVRRREPVVPVQKGLFA